MTTFILVLLIFAAYNLGRYVQWTTDAKRAMGSWRYNDRRKG
jgi:hypothetical protein